MQGQTSEPMITQPEIQVKARTVETVIRTKVNVPQARTESLSSTTTLILRHPFR